MTQPPDRDDSLNSSPNDPTPERPDDVDETVPALDLPDDPESSWSAFLSPPKIALDTALDDTEDRKSDPPSSEPISHDPEATAASVDVDKVLDLYDHDDGDGSFRVIIERASSPVENVIASDAGSDPEPEPIVAAPATDSPPEVQADPAAPAVPQRDFEDLTIAEMLAELRRQPLATVRALVSVVQESTTVIPVSPDALALAGAGASGATASRMFSPRRGEASARPVLPDQDVPEETRLPGWREPARLVLRVIAFIVAWYGTFYMQTEPSRSEQLALFAGLPFLVAGLVIWGLAEVLTGFRRDIDPAVDTAESDGYVIAESERLRTLTRADLAPRIALGVIAAVGSVLALNWNRDNEFTLHGVLIWLVSILLWVWVFAPEGWTPLDILSGIGRRIAGLRHARISFTLIALIVIMGVAAYFRLTDLDLIPREMTSDHVEMLRDTYRISALGATDIFFAGNGGREAFQFYALSAFSSLPGLELSFYSLKLLNALEGILAIPILFWFGRVAVGDKSRNFGTLVGLLLAGMVAVSYWHVIISRIGERIVLTPIIMSLILIFLMRALRTGRRWDWILTGLALGFGLYTYQVIRMVPFVIVIGVAFGLFFHLRNAPRRANLVFGLGIVALISFVIFVPLFGYSLQYPEDYWRRTSGRIFGDEITQTTDENGNLIYRPASFEERLTAFNQNFPVLANNLRNALLMFNWKGDVSWFQNYPNQPAFDAITGGFLVIGAAAWGARMFRRRRVTDWLLPASFAFLLLPSALSIAYPIENPSFTRMSGTLPMAYLFAAIALALILLALQRLLGGMTGRIVIVVAAAGLLAGSYLANSRVYFVDYDREYRLSALPYSDAGEVMRSFAETGPGFGNVFVVSYPYWWDHRALGMSAGVFDFPNTIPSYQNILDYIANAPGRADAYQMNIDQDLLFYYNVADTDAEATLRQLFPNGFAQEMTTNMPEDRYMLYRVPALGSDGYNALLSLR